MLNGVLEQGYDDKNGRPIGIDRTKPINQELMDNLFLVNQTYSQDF